MTKTKTTHKVLFIWPATSELKAYFHRELDSVAEIAFSNSRDLDTITNQVGDADILVGWAVREPILNAAVKTRLVVIPAIGVDRHIPVLRKFPNIQAVNSRGNAVPTAQHTVALLLAVTNHVLDFDAHMRNGQWRAYDDTPPSLLLENVPIGILGTGTVGRETMKRLSGFGCRLIGCSRSGSPVPDFPDVCVYSIDQLDIFLKEIRILIVAVPRTPDTEGLIGAREIALLPENAILINVARGPVVDEKALFEALRDKRLAAAGIDVWYNYQPDEIDGKRYPYTFPFHELDNIVLSPHRASSPLTRPGRYIDVVENIKRFINGEPLMNRIDLDRGY